MTTPGRRLALCAQSMKALTGLDFIQVVNPAVQTVLRLFFVIEPDKTVPPMVAPASVPAISAGVDEGPAVPAGTPLKIFIASAAEGLPIEIVSLNWRRVRSAVDSRVALEIETREPGGFEPYRLTAVHPRLDVLSGELLFDFKQACPTGFDCEADPTCSGDPLVDVEMDYLARDFTSLRRALLDLAAGRYPDWREPIEADFGAMMMEIMAAIGDHFAYHQDRIDAETRFGSATLRASLAAHARLVDYRPFRGSPATGPVLFTAIAPTGGEVPAGSCIWALQKTTPVTFSTLSPLWVHPFWNALAAHNPDPLTSCIGHGATTLMLKSAAVAVDQTPFGVTREEFLVGKRVVILSDPTDPALPHHAVPVTITAIEEFYDPLVLTGGLPTVVTQIQWSADEATTVELPYDGLSVAFNLAEAAAGEHVVEYVRTGPVEALATHQGAIAPTLIDRMAALPMLIEREGPLEREDTGRDIIMRHGLSATEGMSLHHFADGRPNIAIEEVVPPPGPVNPALPELFDLFVTDVAAPDWSYIDDLLTGDLDTTSYTLEPGLWRTVQRHRRQYSVLDFCDYAVDSGWSVRFASGDFGRGPVDGSVLRITYRTDPGVIANLPSKALSLVPAEGGVPDAALALIVGAATNPLPMNGAQSEENASSIRTGAPEAFRANPLRAVRSEDYEAILGKRSFISRANASTCWTGSWSTDFVGVDPVNSIRLSTEQREIVEREIDCIRLAARDARRIDANYLDIDVDISVGIAEGFYTGEVINALRQALASPGFFAPDNFTFGTPLIRSALEATIQAVPGVHFVAAIRIRVSGWSEWRAFSETELVPAPNQIIRLQNDPNRAAMGILSIHSDRLPAGGSS